MNYLNLILSIMQKIKEYINVENNTSILLKDPFNIERSVICYVNDSGFIDIETGKLLNQELGEFITGTLVFDRVIFVPKHGESFSFKNTSMNKIQTEIFDEDNFYHNIRLLKGNCFKNEQDVLDYERRSKNIEI